MTNGGNRKSERRRRGEVAERKVREEGANRKEEVREKFKGWVSEEKSGGGKVVKTLTGRG